MAYRISRPSYFLERRRRDAGRFGVGLNQEKLLRDVKAAQQAKISSGMKLGREATDAAKDAGAIEAGMLFATRGMGGGMQEALRGAMSAQQADALKASEARRRARLLEDVQSTGVQMTEKAAAKASRRAEKAARQAGEAGTFLGMLGGLGSLGMGAAGLKFAAAAAPVLGPIGLGLGALGTVGSSIAQNEGQKAKDFVTDVGKDATEFAAEKLPETTKGFEKIVSMTPQYGSFESSFLGGQGGRRPRRTAQQVTPFADALADISFLE